MIDKDKAFLGKCIIFADRIWNESMKDKSLWAYHLLALLVVAIWGVTFGCTKVLITAGEYNRIFGGAPISDGAQGGEAQ